MKIIQLLNWKLDSIKKELPNIKRQGFDAIQINPMQPFKEEKIFHWYLSYQPLGFRIGNMFGSKEDLKNLCSEAKKYELDIIVDVVLNHTANKSGKECLIPHPSVDSELLNDKSFWKNTRQIKNGDNRWDATANLIGLPGLDLGNPDLQEIIFRYLKELSDCGVKGLRFDAAKHIGLPLDGVDFFIKIKKFLHTNNMYGYGEIIGGNKAWLDEMSKYIMVHSPIYADLSDEGKLVTYFDGHDEVLNEFGNAKDLTNSEKIYLYKKLRRMYENTLCYESVVIDKKNPFYYNKNKFSFDKVYKLNERDYFNTFYIDSKEIEEINKNIKCLRKNFK